MTLKVYDKEDFHKYIGINIVLLVVNIVVLSYVIITVTNMNKDNDTIYETADVNFAEEKYIETMEGFRSEIIKNRELIFRIIDEDPTLKIEREKMLTDPVDEFLENSELKYYNKIQELRGDNPEKDTEAEKEDKEATDIEQGKTSIQFPPQTGYAYHIEDETIEGKKVYHRTLPIGTKVKIVHIRTGNECEGEIAGKLENAPKGRIVNYTKDMAECLKVYPYKAKVKILPVK